MHLKSEPKPLIFSRKISQLYVTFITPGATSNPPCSIRREQHIEHSRDGLVNQVFQHDPAWLLDLMRADSGQLFVELTCQTAVNTLGTIKQCHQDCSTRLMPKSIKTHSKTRNVLLTTKSLT